MLGSLPLIHFAPNKYMLTINSNKLSETVIMLQELVNGMQVDAQEKNSTFLSEAASGVENAANELEQAMTQLESFENGEEDEPLNDPD